MEREFYQYLTPSISDKDWGVYINVAGYGEAKPKIVYPQKGHPSEYFFTWEKGRKLDEFQIIYITDGYGILETIDQEYTISPGTIITLFPNIWHRYRPNQETGWKEYYIGFQGEFANQYVMTKYCNYLNKPVINIGFQEKVLDIF
ncbi:MAG: AraC family ligand binding domain-containing protein, partial [bacterium]